jgi:flagellar basal-body rod protein FlgG
MALRSLSIAATGGTAMQRQIDSIANNLANVNTTGFKRSRADFSDLFYQHLSQAGFASDDGQMIATGIQQGTGVRLLATPKIFEQGALDFTGRPLDLAIEGEGFFRVQRGNEVKYTRAGSFRVDAEGRLVTAQGFSMDPPVEIPSNITQVQVSLDGRVEGLDPDSPNEAQDLGEILLARFRNPSGLRAIGENLYEETGASGQPIEGQPGAEGLGVIRDKTIESSNVDVIREMVDLIEAQRAFEINTRVIQASDEILQQVNTLRR